MNPADIVTVMQHPEVVKSLYFFFGLFISMLILLFFIIIMLLLINKQLNNIEKVEIM